MHLRRFLRHVRWYFDPKRIDWTLQPGDLVVDDDWPRPVEIVDIHWGLMAAAVRLGPDYNAIVIWPLWSLRRYEGQ
jgi:hypothetical protein